MSFSVQHLILLFGCCEWQRWGRNPKPNPLWSFQRPCIIKTQPSCKWLFLWALKGETPLWKDHLSKIMKSNTKNTLPRYKHTASPREQKVAPLSTVIILKVKNQKGRQDLILQNLSSLLSSNHVHTAASPGHRALIGCPPFFLRLAELVKSTELCHWMQHILLCFPNQPHFSH